MSRPPGPRSPPSPVGDGDMGTLGTLRTDLDGRVLTVTIDNPSTDLMDRGLVADLGVLGRRLRRDRRIGAVVLTGPRPGTFIPHYDIEEILAGTEALGLPTPYIAARAAFALVSALRAMPGAHDALARTPGGGLVDLYRTHAALDRLGSLPQVVIAAIDGDALGGGCEVALACDIRIMGAGPYLFGLPELTIGIPPGAGGSVRLSRAVGPARAASMILQSQTVSPSEALDLGLVSQVVRAGEATEAAQKLAVRLAERNPSAVASAKRAIRSARTPVEVGGFVAAASGTAAATAMRDFVARSDSGTGRTPWTDRSALPR